MVTLVRIGEQEAAVFVVSDTEIQFTAPAAAVTGLVDVTVVTDAGEATMADAFEYVDTPVVTISVPDGGGDIPVVYDEPTIYVTRLENHGVEAADVTDEVRLHSEGGVLAADDVVLEAEVGGGGSWTAKTPTVEDGDLVYSDVLTLPANMNSRGRMRITVATGVADLVGTSTITDSEDTVLDSTTYTFVLSGGA